MLAVAPEYTKSCAQRLAASEVEEQVGSVIATIAHTRAQRLAASEVEERTAGYSTSTPTPRAQRLAASEVEEQLFDERGRNQQAVLNALRHQRLKNFVVIKPLFLILVCSTPCGIRG